MWQRKAVKAETKTKDEFIQQLKKVNKDIEVIGDYVNTHTKIKCRCKIDGMVWYAYPANLLNSSAGCPCCSISLGEKILLDTLNDLKINFVPQYSIKDCKHIKTLRFDAFDIDNNIAFEYNGEQHYYQIDFSGKGHRYAEDTFNKTKNRDKSKIDYCNKNNIPIIIVPYWERNNMKNFITNRLKEISNINQQ